MTYDVFHFSNSSKLHVILKSIKILKGEMKCLNYRGAADGVELE